MSAHDDDRTEAECEEKGWKTAQAILARRRCAAWRSDAAPVRFFVLPHRAANVLMLYSLTELYALAERIERMQREEAAR